MAIPSAKYWAKRAESRLAAVERTSDKYLEQMMQNQTRVSNQIRSDVDAIIGRFAATSDLSLDEAKRILGETISEVDRKRLMDIAQTIEDPRARAKMMARVNAPAYKARIDRLEAIELAAEGRMAAIMPQQTALMTSGLEASGMEMFNRTMFDLQRGTGFGFQFAQMTDRQLEAVLKHNWSGSHYSKRIWRSPAVVAEKVRNTVAQNMVTGRSWRRSLDDVRGESNFQGNFEAARLLRTETAYVAGEMEAEAYTEAGLDEYRYVSTLDTRTSETCRELDGKKFKLKDRETGVNYPPMHPFCRSTTVAVIDGFDVSRLQRRARDPETGKTKLVPATMTYREWQQKQTA